MAISDISTSGNTVYVAAESRLRLSILMKIMSSTNKGIFKIGLEMIAGTTSQLFL